MFQSKIVYFFIGPPGIKGDTGLPGAKGDQGAQGNIHLMKSKENFIYWSNFVRVGILMIYSKNNNNNNKIFTHKINSLEFLKYRSKVYEEKLVQKVRLVEME